MKELEIINKFMVFLWNYMDYYKIINLFGDRGEHIYQIWVEAREEGGYEGTPAIFWAKISTDVKTILINEIFNGTI